jgi:hypothetical protein
VTEAEVKLYGLVLGALGVWRVTHLLNAEDGPFHLSARLRVRAGTSFFGALLDCFYCLSLWVAIPFALLLAETIGERLLLWLGLSGAAALLQRASASRDEATSGHGE